MALAQRVGEVFTLATSRWPRLTANEHRSRMQMQIVSGLQCHFYDKSRARPVVEDYGPGALLAWAQRIASGSGPSTWGALAVSLGLVVLTTLIGWQGFRSKEL